MDTLLRVDAVMNKPQQPEPRTIAPTAALVLVAVGLAGLAMSQLGSSVIAPAPWNSDVQLILVQYFAAAQQVASVAVAWAMIVGGLVLIWRDQ